jgi:hypothetical protein
VLLDLTDFNQGIPENATSDQITQARMGGTFNFLNSKEVQDAMRLAGYGGERGWNMNDVLWSENALRDSMNALTKRIGENKQAISQGTTSLAQELAKLGIKV